MLGVKYFSFLYNTIAVFWQVIRKRVQANSYTGKTTHNKYRGNRCMSWSNEEVTCCKAMRLYRSQEI